MKIYIVSSASTPFGSMGRGWYESDITAKRLNKPVSEIESYFKALCRSGMAEEEIQPKKKTVKKVTTRKATSKKIVE